MEIGQRCRLKARALPYESLWGAVDQIAPAAIGPGGNTSGVTTGSANSGAGAVQSTVSIRVQLESGTPELRPGMSGYARIYTIPRPLGQIALDRLLQFVRTEFWW